MTSPLHLTARWSAGWASAHHPLEAHNHSQIKRGAARLPFRACCFVLLLLTGLLFLFAARSDHRPHSSPIRDRKNKRIILVAEVATALAGSTGSGAASRQFYCSRSGRQEPVGQFLSKRISLLRLPPACFYCVGVATCCSCYWVCFLVLVVPIRKHSPCQLLRFLYFQ